MSDSSRLPRDPHTGGIPMSGLVGPSGTPDLAKLEAALTEFADGERNRLAYDAFTDTAGHEVVVSTVDLVITVEGGAAFETMAFSDGQDIYRQQHTDREAALRAHATAVDALRHERGTHQPTSST